MESLREEEYLKAFEIAKSNFLSSDYKKRCRIAGAIWEPTVKGGVIHLPFFNEICRINIPDFKFFLISNQEEPNLTNKILILHYLNGVKDIPLSETDISFKEVPSGEFYYPAFVRRSIEPILRTFGQEVEVFKTVAEQLGGQIVEKGDVGIRVHIFPKVPVTLIYWEGDDEFPPDLNILFDATIKEFLSTEDIAVIAQEIMIRMNKLYFRYETNRGLTDRN